MTGGLPHSQHCLQLKQRVTPFLSFDSYHWGATEHGFQPQLVLVKLLISCHQYYTMAVTRFCELIRVTDGRNQQMSTSVTVGLYKRAILETVSLLSLSENFLWSFTRWWILSGFKKPSNKPNQLAKFNIIFQIISAHLMWTHPLPSCRNELNVSNSEHSCSRSFWGVSDDPGIHLSAACQGATGM